MAWDFRDEETGKLFEQIGWEEYQSQPPYLELYRSDAVVTPSQIACLIGIVKSFRFSNGQGIQSVLEVGTNTGVTDLYLLKCGVKYRDKFRLYSIEKCIGGCYGQAVYDSASKTELSHWQFYPGRTTFNIEEILHSDEQFDMIFIDGAHAQPYPLLDLVLLLPYCHTETLLVLHDVELYNTFGELGGCYLFTALPVQKKYVNWCIDNPKLEPRRKEHMGIFSLPQSKEKLYPVLLEVASQTIDAPHFPYAQGVATTDRLGLDREIIARHLRPFMEKHYDDSFTEAFLQNLLAALSVYKANYISSMHHTRIINNMERQLGFVQRKIKFLQQLVTCNMSRSAFAIEEGNNYAVYGSNGRYQEALRAVRENQAQTIALIDRLPEMQGLTFETLKIYSPEWLKEHEAEYDGIVIASIDDMREVRDSILSLGISSEKILWVDLS